MVEPRPMVEWEIFPFVGDVRVKDLAAPVLPEPPRAGDPGGPPCGSCARPDEHDLWADDAWRLIASPRPTAVPFVILETRAHHDLADMPVELVADLGPMLQRVESALMDTGRFGRVHINRWGDGGAHFHIWLYGRPLGARQLLGAFLPVWNGVLPPMDANEWWDVLSAVAENLVARGGRCGLVRPS
jgi:diadenosine tetraphosphate (Ap4A) HIT family hydrolase